jgi:hypothetical protein
MPDVVDDLARHDLGVGMREVQREEPPVFCLQQSRRSGVSPGPSSGSASFIRTFVRRSDASMR